MKSVFLLPLLLITIATAQTDVKYQLPPKVIMDLADVKPVPSPYINHDGSLIVFIQNADRMSLEMLAEPELKLAGLRINPNNCNKSRQNPGIGIRIQNMKTGKDQSVKGLPEKLAIMYAQYSPRENYFSFVNCLSDKLELWIIDLKTFEAIKIENVMLSAVMNYPYEWSANEKEIYLMERANKGKYPDQVVLPEGPVIQEADGKKSPSRTYQDLLKNKNDEKKFDFYAETRIKRYLVADKRIENHLSQKVYSSISVSPDGSYLLTYELSKPYSYQLPYEFFGYSVNVFDYAGKLERNVTAKLLLDKIPQGFNACETGIREVQWRSDEKSSLIYVVAQDDGDPKKEAQYRDEVFCMRIPNDAKANLIARTVNRFQSIVFGPNRMAIMADSWWKTRNQKLYLLDGWQMLGQKVIFDYSTEDLYNLPGNFDQSRNADGNYLLTTTKDFSKLYLKGEGYSPEGKKPFIDEYDVKSGKTVRLWQAENKTSYERVVKVINMEKGDMITRIEAQKTFPNYWMKNFRTKKGGKQITNFENPYKSIETITKQKIEYLREDGVKLSANLYLPAGYNKEKDGRLPMLVHAYPTEYKDDKAAGQRKDSPHEFIMIGWGSPIFWVTRGYAVLDNAQFPIIGKGEEEPNDTYITQLVANGKAAIKTVSDMGICDEKRVGVMGHSYGAFMTANLLAHSDLFAAGIARSGAYNRTLTPFGFQSEERTFWQATKVYNEMSPFNHAEKINEPILLIHGEQDNNPGTFTLQSERLFQAIKGLGGKARLVILPYESHGYAAKENVFHMLWEMDNWLEMHVKNRK